MKFKKKYWESSQAICGSPMLHPGANKWNRMWWLCKVKNVCSLSHIISFNTFLSFVWTVSEMIIIFSYMFNAGSLPTLTHKCATTLWPMTSCQVTSLLFTFSDIANSISGTEITYCRNFMCSHIQLLFSMFTQINFQLVGAQLKIKRMKPILELFQPGDKRMLKIIPITIQAGIYWNTCW